MILTHIGGSTCGHNASQPECFTLMLRSTELLSVRASVIDFKDYEKSDSDSIFGTQYLGFVHL